MNQPKTNSSTEGGAPVKKDEVVQYKNNEGGKGVDAATRVPAVLPTPPFQYQPLNTPEDSFRLIQILPGSDKEIVCCKLWSTTTKTAADEGYNCLSYQWKKPTDMPSENMTHEIRVNGCLLSIGESLWDFLTTARERRLTDTPLWIDALCINQRDVAERNHQVKKMGQIYKMANEVLIWLGYLSPTLPESWREMEEFHDKHDHIWDSGGWKNRSSNQEVEKIWIRDTSLVYLSSYWSRLWIVQEIELAQNLAFYFPTLTVEVIHFFQVTHNIMRCHEPSTSIHDVNIGIIYQTPGFSMIWSYYVNSIDAFRQLASLRTLSDFLFLYHKHQCQEKLDHVYGLLSLAKDGASFAVDYNSSPESLLNRVMEYSMDGMPIDRLLFLGGNLIENFDLRTDQVRATHSSSSRISQIFSGYAIIEIEDQEGQVLTERIKCLYMAVFDGGDAHVFEYALDMNGPTVKVRFFRAHEYLRGTLRISQDVPKGREGVLWFDSPSEDVFYFHGSDKQPLVSWKAVEFPSCEILFNLYDNQNSLHESNHRRLEPSRRGIKDDFTMAGGTIEIPPSWFIATARAIDEKQYDVYPRTARATAVYPFAKKNENDG